MTTNNKTFTGLTDEEVIQSREKHGANILSPAKRDSLWKRFFEKLTGPFGHHIKGWQDGDHLIFILEIAALLSLFISVSEYLHWFGLEGKDASVFFEPLGIFIAIFLATGIAFVFELKADKEFSLLNQVNDEEQVQVLRNGNRLLVPKKDVVVGDIIIIETGNEVPADAELLEATTLKLDESSLTGEPVCEKTIIETEFDDEATFPSNYIMRGTKVMEGHGVARVFAVGDQTENGKVMEAAQIDDSIKTPLNEQLDGLGSLITKLSYTLAILVIIGRIVVFLTTKDFVLIQFVSYLLETFMIAVTLVVVSVPEGLPMAVSLALALSMRKMLKTNNLVRKMHACETMGATTVICTDKTGTLTQNQMQVYQTKFYALADNQLSNDTLSLRIKEGIAVNSTAQLDFSDPEKATVIGNPTEGALLLWLHSQAIDYRALKAQTEVIEEIPFSTERKYMATLVRGADGRKVLYIKGAPEIIFSLSKEALGGVGQAEIDAQLAEYQNQAMRTLGFAYQEIDDENGVIVDGVLHADGLKFLGVVAISDPVRADVPAAVSECFQAGIRVKIVTGDTSGTAKEIGRQIGLWNDATDTDENIITGPEFAALSDEELSRRILDLKIISRARPMDKKRLVETLQAKGEVVAVTGDGTNDAPALKAAQVGLSMGDGTSVAKEASDITILDNSFSSIGLAVMWGRSLYHNIQRFILFQMTVNVAACLVVLVGAFMGTESPLTVTQMLWVNLIMDTFAAIALAGLPPTPNVMKEKPRNRNSFIISRVMKFNILATGGLFSLFLLALVYVFEHTDITSLSDFATIRLGNHDRLTPYELSLFFTIFVMLQFWNMFNARAFSTRRSAFHFKRCKSFLGIAAVILGGQILIVTIGGQLFNVTPLSLSDWLVIIIGTSSVLWVSELWRFFKARKTA